MLAIVNILGKQYRVSEGDKIKIASLNTEVGKKVTFDTVLFTDNGKEITIGTPIVKDASVSAKILEHGRDRKILIYKKKRRKGYQRKNGHRQAYSLVQIDKISFSASKTKSKATPKTSATKTKKRKHNHGS